MEEDSFDIGPKSVFQFHLSVKNIPRRIVFPIRIEKVENAVLVDTEIGATGVIQLGKCLSGWGPRFVESNRKKDFTDIGYGPIRFNPDGDGPPL